MAVPPPAKGFADYDFRRMHLAPHGGAGGDPSPTKARAATAILKQHPAAAAVLDQKTNREEPEMLKNIRFITTSTMLASAALVVGGVIQLTDEQSGVNTVVGTVEHVGLATFSLMLVALVPLILHLGRLAGRVRLTQVAAAAMGVLAALSVSSNINGEDLAIFPVIAAPANLIVFGTLITLAVGLPKRGVSLPVAIALPLTWVLALPGSQVGGGIAAAAIFALIAYRVSTDTLIGEPAGEPRPGVVAEAAA